MSKKNEKREKRANIYEQTKAIMALAETENRDLTAEEQTNIDKAFVDMDSLQTAYETEERMEKIGAEMLEVSENAPRPEPETRGGIERLATDEYRDAYTSWVREGFNGNHGIERRDLEAGDGAEGGYTVPDLWDRTVREKAAQINIMDQLADVQVASNLTKFSVEGDLGAHAIVAEEGDASATSDVSFGQKIIDAYKFVRLIKVSEELLQDSFTNIPAYLAKKMGTSYGNAREAYTVNGTGSGEPQGVFGAAGVGVTAASPIAVTSNELIDLFHSLLAQYRRGASFIVNDATAKIVRKLTIASEAGNYVWQPGLQAGQPDLLLGKPVHTSPSAPLATAGLRSICFGDYSHFMIMNRQGQTLQRLNELYSETGKVGFKHTARFDSELLTTEAVKVMLMAAS
ncbi:hypothetical protein LCGC14_1669350 [marine sediment metagenome]|uniref:Phage capsid-like C-terminal domain-containing protein n=1 Tax=marine sediment metagenome TaxID=412755 RepID=A0A0F9HSP8_9ZZZZ